MTRYALAIFAFGTIYGCSPLVKTWVAHVVGSPAEKRAVAIAIINGIGKSSKPIVTVDVTFRTLEIGVLTESARQWLKHIR